jgi:hypothetical protein
MDGIGLSSGNRGDDATMGLAGLAGLSGRGPVRATCRLRGEGMEGMGLSSGTSGKPLDPLGIGELNALNGLFDGTGEPIELGLSHSRGQVRIQSMAWRMPRTDSLNFPRSPKAIWMMSNIFSCRTKSWKPLIGKCLDLFLAAFEAGKESSTNN